MRRILAREDAPASDPREEEAHQAPERNEQKRKEHRHPLNRHGHGSCPSGRRTPDEDERDRDIPHHEAKPAPAEFRRWPLRPHSEAWTAGESLSPAPRGHPRGS